MPQPFVHAMPRARTLRAGFTTLELLIAISVTLVLIALAAPLYQAQTAAVNRTSGRTDATRSATFAIDAIEQDMRNTGVGVFDGQPLMVRGAVNAVSFNANMVTARSNDLVAVFYDPDADSTALGSLNTGTAITLPNSASTYPTASYVSNAETINYYVVSDTGASPIPGGQKVVLYRKVNRQSPEVIARNLVQTTGLPVFRYYKRNLSGVLTQVAAGSLPMFHSVSKHGAAADTGSAALIDSIAVVKIALIATYTDSKGGTIIDTVTRDIRIANQGLLQRAQCGESPLAAGAPALTIVTLSGLPAVKLVWNASTDELAGERDVEMYAVYRRLAGAVDWGEPLTNVPGAGMSSLQYIDNTVASGTIYEYAISALDCTPAPSALTSAIQITVP
ncbi:MAG: type II secretion system protein [Gemmatimonadaceae bacterium]|nr:type II secretion system protein [Gemmatimonadaceae bacterium]